MSGKSRTYAPQLDKSMGGRSIGSQVTEYDEPQHWMVSSRSNIPHADHFVNVETAMKQRTQRLKDAGISHAVSGNVIRYVEADGSTVALTYSEDAP